MYNRPKHSLRHVLLLALALLFLVSCSSDDPSEPTNRKTLLMYLPWSGDTYDLSSCFWQNVSDMKTAYDALGDASVQVVVFISTSSTKGVMFNINDYCGNNSTALASYSQVSDHKLTTADGIATILSEMKSMAPANNYSLVIGCHGMGWLPTAKTSTTKRARAAADAFVPYWQNDDPNNPTTRYFGGSSVEYQTDISTLVEGIERTGTKMDFILFDDCYMSTIEVAYDLRQVADYVIACPTEVMSDGMPYASIGRYLLGTPDYSAVCQRFVEHYSTDEFPFGTIGVAKCDELDSLASIMRRVNSRDTFNVANLGDLQRMDGYTPVIFFDYGDYVAHLCKDSTLLEEFNEQLARAVPYKGHTEYFPTTLWPNGAISVSYTLRKIKVNAFSGITTSEPSVNERVTSCYTSTAWYKATH